jgi:hypothetical protein
MSLKALIRVFLSQSSIYLSRIDSRSRTSGLVSSTSSAHPLDVEEILLALRALTLLSNVVVLIFLSYMSAVLSTHSPSPSSSCFPTPSRESAFQAFEKTSLALRFDADVLFSLPNRITKCCGATMLR